MFPCLLNLNLYAWRLFYTEVLTVMNVKILASYRAGLHGGYALDSYSGGSRFKSRLGHRISWVRVFIIFCTPSKKIIFRSSLTSDTFILRYIL
jgi:hypothetical protein